MGRVVILVMVCELMLFTACNKNDQMDLRRSEMDIKKLTIGPMPVDSLELDSLRKARTN